MERRDLSSSRWVYWWADGIHTGVRSDDSDGQCMLVIIGVRPEGTKERVAIRDGYLRRFWLERREEHRPAGIDQKDQTAGGFGGSRRAVFSSLVRMR